MTHEHRNDEGNEADGRLATVPFNKDQVVTWVQSLQEKILTAFQKMDPQIQIQKTSWERPGGGGGETRMLMGGELFEKGGVNVSVVHGELSSTMQEKLQVTSSQFFATGISLVIHPASPQIPTVHMNCRYFEQPDRAWFGGGMDLTPYVYSEEDGIHFHQCLKSVCDSYEDNAYQRFKKECDQYFWIKHRQEARGIGGIFFDYLSGDFNKIFAFVRDCGEVFLEAYGPLVLKNKDKPFTEREKKFQFLRRGRYVEFNLMYDRGTLFGLHTQGNMESILMSLPPVVHYDYNPDLETTESEKKLMNIFRHPREWVMTEV